jgi:hypothetical protein
MIRRPILFYSILLLFASNLFATEEKTDKGNLSKSVEHAIISNDENLSDSISPKVKRFNDQSQGGEQSENVEVWRNEVVQSEETIQEDHCQHGNLFLLSSRKLPQIQSCQETNAVIQQECLGTSSSDLKIIESLAAGTYEVVAKSMSKERAEISSAKIRNLEIGAEVSIDCVKKIGDR